MKIKHGMILTAGLGKRMQPITLKTPKPLIQIGNKNLIERAIKLLINHGIEEIVINVHYLPDQIKNFICFSNHGHAILRLVRKLINIYFFIKTMLLKKQENLKMFSRLLIGNSILT